MKTLLFLASLTSMAVLGLLVAYVAEKDSNHTALEPWLLTVVFVPTTLLGGVSAFNRDLRFAAAIAIGAGIAGMSCLAYLDITNTLLQYDRWIERGMP